MTQIKADPYSVSCDQCKAPEGMGCTYVHPRDWTADSQRRFFHNKTQAEQIEILQKAGTYTKVPHLNRFVKAKKVRDEAKTEVFKELYSGEPILTWNRPISAEAPDSIVINRVIFRSDAYIDRILAHAHEEWEAKMETQLRAQYREGWAAGKEEGKKVAINLIATGSEYGQ